MNRIFLILIRKLDVQCPAVYVKSCLTLFGTGLKIYVKWQGGDVHHHPLLNTQNHCEKPKNIFFAFQIGHIEIGKVTKFGDVWRPF